MSPLRMAIVVLSTVGAITTAGPAHPQSLQPDPAVAAYAGRLAVDQDPLVGNWTYRSLRNNPDPSVEFNKLRFAVATLAFAAASQGEVRGTLGGPGWSLALRGNRGYGNPFDVRFQGKGEIGGEIWVYDYVGYLVPSWPNGEDQRPAIVGSVIRTVPHADGSGGTAEAGYVASFVAVKQD